jgi:glycerophosphoryl diester phosphodiesterase
LEAGAGGVEVDVRRCAQDGLVCCHDPDKAGVTLLTATVFQLSERGIASVEAVLDAVLGRGQVVLEIKNRPGEADFDAPRERTAGLLLELLRGRRTAGLDDDVVISSFDWHALDAVRADRDHPDWAGRPPRTGMLLHWGIALSAGLATAVESGYDEVHAPVRAVRRAPDVIARAHDAGLQVVAWTVRSVATARTLRDVGVDAIICDDPAAVVRALGGG